MAYEMHFDAPLGGKTAVPGDERLTLALMAFAMRPDAVLTIMNPSPAPSVGALREFLEANGAGFAEEPGGFTLTGSDWPSDAVIGPDVSDDVLHILLPGAVRSGNLRIAGSGGSRMPLVEHLISVLEPFGMDRDALRVDGGDIVIDRMDYVPPQTVVTARSDWDLEAIAAAAGAMQSEVTVSYPAAAVSHSLKLVSLAGGRWEAAADDREMLLNRRLAKATGDTPPVAAKLDWETPAPARAEVPGDTTIAAAVTAAALMLPKSKVTIGDVLWEQGRRGFWDAVRRMKGSVETKARSGGLFDAADVTVRHGSLAGIHLSPAQALTMRSELLLLGALASAAAGESVVNDAADAPGMGRERFMTLTRGLERLGCKVGNYTDGLVLEGGRQLRGAHLESGGDPQVALALAVAALSASGTMVIEDAGDDTWPVGSFRGILRNCAAGLSG